VAQPLFPDRLPERLTRCVAGLVCFGLGISMLVTAHLGLAPWDVLHQGISNHTGLSIGWVIVIVGLLLLLLWIPLRQRAGLGTILNALQIGLVVNVVVSRLPVTDLLIPRVLYVIGGLLVIGVGSGLYIGAGLGAGPRDGLMVGLSQRGVSVHLARTALEITVLVAGVALGGKVGFGTVAFTLAIGPIVHQTIPRMQMREPEPALAIAH